MSEKEERILILRGNSHKLCRQLAVCIGTGNCAECKIGIPRSEAVERMAAAMCMRANRIFDCTDCLTAAKGDCEVRLYHNMAKAALDALVGKNLSALDKLNKVN